MNEPHWLVQELAGEAVWTVLAIGGVWAWKKRHTIAAKLGLTPKDIVVNLQPLTLRAEPQTIRVTVNDKIGVSDSVTTTVRKDVDLRWRVLAPTPSLARRLEDLAAWYLNVS